MTDGICAGLPEPSRLPVHRILIKSLKGDDHWTDAKISSTVAVPACDLFKKEEAGNGTF